MQSTCSGVSAAGKHSASAEGQLSTASSHKHTKPRQLPGKILLQEILNEEQANSREVTAWVFQDFVNSPYSQVAIGEFC